MAKTTTRWLLPCVGAGHRVLLCPVDGGLDGNGAWILTDADVLRGRTLTSYPSLKTDLQNAGAKWVNEEVHVDNGLVSSRTPADLDAFNAKLVEEFAEGQH